jgi:hypothetical protein
MNGRNAFFAAATAALAAAIAFSTPATAATGAEPFYGDEAGNKLTALLKEHIMGAVDLLAAAKANDLTLKEALDRFAGKYADDVRDYDAVHDHILGLADTLASGIAAQFPDKVKG